MLAERDAKCAERLFHLLGLFRSLLCLFCNLRNFLCAFVGLGAASTHSGDCSSSI